MSERYIPPEARGIPANQPEKPKEKPTQKSWLRKQSESAFRVLAFVAAGIGAEGAARAEAPVQKPEWAEKFQFDKPIVKTLKDSQFRDVQAIYLQGHEKIGDVNRGFVSAFEDDEPRPAKKDSLDDLGSPEPHTAYVTRIRIATAPGDRNKTTELTEDFYRVEGPDGKVKILKSHGMETERKGMVVTGPQLTFEIGYDLPMLPEEIREDARGTLANLNNEYREVLGFEAVGQFSSPEGQYAASRFVEAVSRFQKAYPEVKLPAHMESEVRRIRARRLVED